MEFGQKPNQSRRFFGIGAVIVFHVVLIWALVNGLARKAIELLPPPIETKIIKEVKPPDEPPPPPPPPKLDTPPPPFVPPPEINIATPPPTNTITVQDKAPTPPPPKPAPPKAPPSFPLKVTGKGCRAPEYPPISQRLGEEGSVVLQLKVGVDGKVTDSRIQTSSGYNRLDEAARKALSLCQFQPAIVDGQKVPAWGALKYTFRAE
ncbi:energy transducer TonB [Solimonas marina]|uniref:Protein TonB n=1 Tax=Solimonas marina TaxID=2714601 RepID=A0A969WAA1_9GAMM|nr:energy transducer TonB [Solimonas marina]NKF22338.1 TonB family protein [Solimonas marina]